ncbi:hypothetical protein GCM10008098_00380 [Rhodanobacter panaciterrae]|jgi:hypothetical protein|uniref:Uncharacterized protein n=1 Tax=Rhodanobacter panaciterrae TaxID=490572 RepID=A0ABQ2ZFH8_9GAMM|nr:hypothetical protein [Rhodanobacter panaciterrae]GGY13671.1 hypothetical protein GCM10008098_00380 [Rhodanobacter panaciterrae]
MKFESQILAALFVACFGVCALVMGAMLKTTPASVQLAGTSKATAVALVSPASCALPTSCARAGE